MSRMTLDKCVRILLEKVEIVSHVTPQVSADFLKIFEFQPLKNKLVACSDQK